MRSDFKRVLSILEQLHKEYPTHSVAKHISTATADYGDIWSLSDKDLYKLLKDYKSIIPPEAEFKLDEFVSKIEEDAKHIFEDDYLKEEDGYQEE